MRKIILVLLALKLTSGVCAQGFNNGYLLSRLACAFRGVQSSGDTIYAQGYFVDTVPPYLVKYVVSQIDAAGNATEVYSNQLDTSTEYFTQSHFLRKADGSMILVGSKNNYGGGVFIALKPSGELDFYSEYTDSFSLGFRYKQIEALSDTSYVVLAEQYDGSSTIGTSILKLSSNGSVQWKRVLSFVETPNSVKVLGRGGIIVSTTRYFGSGINRRFNTRFYHLDSDGNDTGMWTDTSNKTFGANKYLETTDGGIYVCRWLEDIQNLGGNPPSFGNMASGYIVREDTAHRKIWQLKIGQASQVADFFQVKQLSDGNFLAVGAVYDSTWMDGQPYKNTGWLVKFSADGELLWQRKYFRTTDRPAQKNTLYDFAELPDGSIVAVGERIDFYEDYPQQGWVLKLNSEGCLLEGCEVGIPEPRSLIDFSIFPNPGNGQVTVRITEQSYAERKILTVTNSLGQALVRMQMQNEFESVSVSALPRGCYFFRIESGQKSAIQKFIKY